MTERGTEQWKGSSAAGQSPAQHSCCFPGCTARERCDLGGGLVLRQGESATPGVFSRMRGREVAGLEDLEGCQGGAVERGRKMEETEYLEIPQHFRA